MNDVCCPHCTAALPDDTLRLAAGELLRRSGVGRPRRVPRCPCGAMSLARAEKRGHRCRDVCPACGAVSHGNITCPTCRNHHRETDPRSKAAMDHLDSLNIPFVAPATAEDVRPFIEKLERINRHGSE